jgi:hypothetical protein
MGYLKKPKKAPPVLAVADNGGVDEDGPPGARRLVGNLVDGQREQPRRQSQHTARSLSQPVLNPLFTQQRILQQDGATNINAIHRRTLRS